MLLKSLVLTACVAYVSAQCAPNGALSVEVTPGEKAYIESPNYGNDDYPNNANCQWNVNSPNSAKLAIEVNSVAFSLEGVSCGFDYVSIFQVNSNRADVLLGKFCGEAGPQGLVASSTRVIQFEAGSNLCSGSDSVCIRPDQYCDGSADCPDGSDKGAICSGECGATAIPPKEDKSVLRFRGVVSDRASGKLDRIVGGVEATPHSLPWQVAMLSSSGSQFSLAS
ncbi:hypothetical protein RvY_00477 [Ramazzottius varieornatus]|uniref:CUB domain-containing protein n=1 Tax=Ramazzottius varieornatus TaxID=947166 RepID=A0A1D1UJ75_RAMVA|nr:hypothetical protein RvY_00477 [Ramazzottius varieornatus]